MARSMYAWCVNREITLGLGTDVASTSAIDNVEYNSLPISWLAFVTDTQATCKWIE